MTAPYKLTIVRGFIAALIAAPLGFAAPWLVLYLLFFAKRLGLDVDPSSEGAWLASYFFASTVGAAGLASFSTKPRSSVAVNFVIAAGFAMTLVFIATVIEGPRLKSDPPFGAKPLDIVLLTVPAIAAGIAILIWRALNSYPIRRIADEGK